LAKNEILKSHCVLVVLDLSAMVMDSEGNVTPTKEIEQILEAAKDPIVLLNKVDLVQTKNFAKIKINGRLLECLFVSLLGEP
jgi:tRNA U34 5-carboxymethylaminomethyl modifying GTPase MnmE/TrmE